MASYNDRLASHARLAILRFLEDATQYTSNVSMLAALLPDVGLPMTRDQIATEARWLEEQGLVNCEEHREGFIIVTATQRGVEAARGIASVPGVERPRPGG